MFVGRFHSLDHEDGGENSSTPRQVKWFFRQKMFLHILLTAWLLPEARCLVATQQRRHGSSSFLPHPSPPQFNGMTASSLETSSTKLSSEVATERFTERFSRESILSQAQETVLDFRCWLVNIASSTSHGASLRILATATSIGAYWSSQSSHRQLSRGKVKTLKRYWWSLPLGLCLVPLVTSVLLETTPATPCWWKLVNLEPLWQSPPADHARVNSLLTLFLCSNASYLIAGLFLLRKYPMVKLRDEHSILPPASRVSISPPFAPLIVKYVPSRGTWLSLWMLLAGFVSTVFHAVQAYGEYITAEAWCYFDHGVAITATLYYLHYCKAPQRLTWIVGGLGVLLLAIPLPGYLFLHSTWHFLSAGAAVLWALQPAARRRAQLERTLVRLQA